MHLPPWFWIATVPLLSWGVVGLLQKLSTNHLSAEWSVVWWCVGMFLLEPWLYSGPAMLKFPVRGLIWALLSGAFNALGAWALFAALKCGGKASVVSPFTSLYPVVVVFLAPFVLRESITALQAVGIVSALMAVTLLST
jgi:transporter family protein